MALRLLKRERESEAKYREKKSEFLNYKTRYLEKQDCRWVDKRKKMLFPKKKWNGMVRLSNRERVGACS